MRVYGPELNDGKHVFVFGSNLAGIHGAGAAKEAVRHWGAIGGFAEGHVGDSYAIPTRDAFRQNNRLQFRTLPAETVAPYVEDFIAYARRRPELTFLVTRVGCGLAGHKDSDIAPMFAGSPANCILPEEWRKKP